MCQWTAPLLWRSLVLSSLVLVIAACGGGGGNPATPAPTGVALPAGLDFFTTTSASVTVALPAGFFGSGSLPFNGTIPLESSPPGTVGPFESGSTDTVIRRSDDSILPAASAPTNTSIEIVSLNLVSTDPVVIDVGSSGTQDWDVTVELPTPLAPREGVMTVEQTGAGQYVFTAEAWLKPTLIFSRGGVTLRLDMPEFQVEGGGAIDMLTVDPADGLEVPYLPLSPWWEEAAFSSATLTLFLQRPAVDPTRPPANIDPSAVVPPDVGSIGRNASLAAGVIVGAGTVIGSNTQIGTGSAIGRDVLIAQGVQIGPGCTIEDGAVIGTGVSLGDGSMVGAGSTIGRGSRVGPMLDIGQGSFLGFFCQLGDRVQVGSGVKGGNNLQLGSDVVINANLRVANGASLAGGSTLTQDLMEGRLPDETLTMDTIANIEAVGAAVLGQVEVEVLLNRAAAASKVTSKTPIPPGALPADLANLQNDVNAAGTGTAAGPIKDRLYNRATYDCDDFAHDMERALTAKGYDATMTYYACWDTVFEGEIKRWYWRWEYVPQILRAHALVDVHSSTGRIIWVEPQTGQVGVDLDFDGDGKVGYATTRGTRLTDGNYRIEVYADRAAGDAAGVPWD